jgi:hypothetical protein
MRLNRRTGTITPYTGQFDPEGGSFGPGDMDTGGNLWWIGDEVNNLTKARQAQTKFSADTLLKIGSATSNGSNILYPAAGQVRVDRHSGNRLVWQLDQADDHSIHGNLYAWNNDTRIQTYFLGRTTWDDHPGLGIRNRVWDIDSDGNGNLWCISLDDSGIYTLLWKVTPAGVQTVVTDLSAYFTAPNHVGFPIIKWVQSDDTVVINEADTLVKCRVSDGAVTATGLAPVTIQYEENYQSFHHSNDALTSVYIVEAGTTGPIFYEINLLTLATTRSINFAGVAGCVGVFYNGFTQSYDASRVIRPISAFYDPVLGGCWTEEFFSGLVAAFGFGDVPVTPPTPPPPPPPVIVKNVGCNPLNMRIVPIDSRILHPFS